MQRSPSSPPLAIALPSGAKASALTRPPCEARNCGDSPSRPLHSCTGSVRTADADQLAVGAHYNRADSARGQLQTSAPSAVLEVPHRHLTGKSPLAAIGTSAAAATPVSEADAEIVSGHDGGCSGSSAVWWRIVRPRPPDGSRELAQLFPGCLADNAAVVLDELPEPRLRRSRQSTVGSEQDPSERLRRGGTDLRFEALLKAPRDLGRQGWQRARISRDPDVAAQPPAQLRRLP